MTNDSKDEFDFDVQNVVPAQSQPDTGEPLVSYFLFIFPTIVQVGIIVGCK